MKLILYLVALTCYIATSDSSVYKNIKEDVLSFLKRSYDDDKPRFQIETNNARKEKNALKRQPNLFQKAMMLKKKSKKEYEIQKRSRKELEAREKAKREARLDNTKTIGKGHYQLDPVLNFVKRRDFRRRIIDSSSTDDSSSSSVEMQNWKDEWKEHWIQKKFEAINSTVEKNDVVNMVAASEYLL